MNQITEGLAGKNLLLLGADTYPSGKNRELPRKMAFVDNGGKPTGFSRKKRHNSEKCQVLEKVGFSR